MKPTHSPAKRLEHGLEALQLGGIHGNWYSITDGLEQIKSAMEEVDLDLPKLKVEGAERARLMRWDNKANADSSGWLDIVSNRATYLFPRPNRLSGDKDSAAYREKTTALLQDIWAMHKAHNDVPTKWDSSINRWISKEDNRWLALWLEKVGRPDQCMSKEDNVLSVMLSHAWPNGLGWKKWFTNEQSPVIQWESGKQAQLWDSWARGWLHCLDGKFTSAKVVERRWNERAEPLRQLNLHTSWRPSVAWFAQMKSENKNAANGLYKGRQLEQALAEWERWPEKMESMLSAVERTDLHRHLKRSGLNTALSKITEAPAL